MGNEAEVLDEEITDEEVETTSDVLEEDAESDDSEGDGQDESGDESESETQSEETLSQDEVNRIVASRVNKYKGAVNKVDGELEKAKAELKLLREKDALKDLALEQAKADRPKSSEPNPDSFDGGTDDPAYIAANREFIRNEMRDEVSKQVAEATRQNSTQASQEQIQREVLRAQEGHVQKAIKFSRKFGVKDYEANEARGIEIIGQDNANYLMADIENSPALLNYLGLKANESEAMEIARLSESNPGKANRLIGGILSKLKASPGKSKPIPQPDEELQGGSRPKAKKYEGPPGAKFY